MRRRRLSSYINGLALHGAELIEGELDPVRLGFVKTALASACLLLQTQWESRSFRRAFRYTIVGFLLSVSAN